MDSDWKCLVEEMWEAYLCEENIGTSSFYDASSTESFSNIFDMQFDQYYSFEEVEFLLENSEQTCPDDKDQYLEPVENMFELMEEAALLSSHEEVEEQKEKSDGDPRCDMKSCQEEKNTKDAETNTRRMKTIPKSKSGEKRKRNMYSYKKRSHQTKKEKE